MSRHRQHGQASVEILGLAVALGIALLIGWQVLLAAHTWQAAQSAARTAARAGSVGAPVRRAALAVLPDRLAARARVREVAHGPARTVEVRIAIPSVLPFVVTFGAVSGEAEVR